MKRSLAILLVLLLALPAFALAGEEKVLNVLTWAEYIDYDTLIQPFEALTGIRIQYSYFDSNEEMLMKLEATDGSLYDLVLASDYILDIARKEELLLPLDKSLLPSLSNIDPVFQGQFFDPDDAYAIPYAAGTPLIVYDPAYVNIDMNSYESLWDPSLKDSIVMIDDARVIIGITLKTFGLSFNTTDPAQLAEAATKLTALKPNIRVLDYNAPHMVMITGEATVGFMFTPQVLWALYERPDLQVAYPKEGMGFGIDALVIPKNAPHPENAHAFIEFLLQPENAVQIAEVQMYLNCNQAAAELLSEEYRSNPALYIPSEILGQTEFIQDVGDAQLIFNDIWTAFKQ